MKWIDRNKQTPQTDFEVIGSCDDDVKMCIYRDTGYNDYFELENGDIFEVTHWMNKPEPFLYET